MSTQWKPRSMWSGAIQFGMVVIPVKMYLATEDQDFKFNHLHRGCGERVKYANECPTHGKLDQPDITRGYEYAKGQYVEVSDADLAALPTKSLKTVTVDRAVAAEELSGAFVKSDYYLEPEPIGRRAFALFKNALASQGVVAVGKIAVRDRESLAAVSVHDKVLRLRTLRWPDEVRAAESLESPEEKVTAAEQKVADDLIRAMRGELDFTSYSDEYRAAVGEMLEEKVTTASAPARARKPASLPDLMETLRASVEQQKTATKKSRRKESAA